MAGANRSEDTLEPQEVSTPTFRPPRHVQSGSDDQAVLPRSINIDEKQELQALGWSAAPRSWAHYVPLHEWKGIQLEDARVVGITMKNGGAYFCALSNLYSAPRSLVIKQLDIKLR